MNLPRHLPATWRNRDFLLSWGGQALSGLGSSMSGLAFPLLILALTHSPALAGTAGMLHAAPFALLGPFVGALVDRWDARRVMLWADAGRAIALGSIPLAWLMGHLSLGQLYVVTTVEGSLLVCFHTAHVAALPRLAPAEQLAAASAQEESAYYATALVGPPIGGALFSLGRVLPFLADALSFVLSVVSLLLLRTDLGRHEEAPAVPLWADVREGVAWLWRSPLLRALALLDIPETLVTSGLGLLVVVLAQRQHAGPAAIGAVFAVAGCGGVVGAVASAWLSQRLCLGPLLLAVRWTAVLLWTLYLLAPIRWPWAPSRRCSTRSTQSRMWRW